MKALRIRFAVSVLFALTLLCATVLLSKPVSPAKQIPDTVRLVPPGMLSSSVNAPALRSQEGRGNGAPSFGRSPLNRCLDAVRPSTPPQDSTPSAPGIDAMRVEKQGNVIRLVPNTSAPEATHERVHPQGGSLDQGADACPATDIQILPYTDSGTLRGKTRDFENVCGSPLPDVIYHFTAQHTALHSILLNSDSWNTLLLRTGGACPGTTALVCRTSEVNTTQILRTLTVGETYFVIVDADTTEGHGAYTLDVSEVTECNFDMSLTAPGTVSGNTCFAGDDCPLGIGEDQMVKVTIPHAGRWQFGLCDGQRWPATIYLSASCCFDTALATTSYGCAYSPPYYYERPLIYWRTLSAGDYYLDVEGVNANTCGSWTLTVEELPGCVIRPPNDECVNAGPPATLPATFTGNNTCATHDCPLIPEGQGETWHAFQLDSPADIVLDYCGTPSYFYEMAEVLVVGCPGTSVIHSTEIGYIGCTYSYEALLWRNLPAGTYYYPVIRDSAWGGEGPYVINVRAVPTCQIESQPGDIIECLDYPALSRTGVDCDNGCGANPHYQDINIGETVYGRGFTYLDINNHRQWDSDWFTFNLPDTAIVTLTITAEFPFSAGIYDGDCYGGSGSVTGSTIEPCDTLTLTTRALRPGDYVYTIRPAYFLAPTDTAHYRATLTSTPCAWPVVITPQPGDIPEGEPICQDNYHDSYNPGCDGDSIVFQTISCGDTIVGTAGTFRRNGSFYRDEDWYRVQLSQRGIVTVSVVAEFDVYLFVDNYCPGCDLGLSEGGGYMGDLLRISTLCVEAGDYYIAILPNDWGTMLPCGTRYRMTVSCDPCVTCTDMHQPQDLVENEPPCSTWVNHPDHFNGGCESSPPAYGPELQCGESIWGTSGTWYGGNGYHRDTDWMPITLASREVLRFCVTAQFPVMTTIVGPGEGVNSCADIPLYSEIATGEACDTVCVSSMQPLNPGTYWLFVAPTAFSNVICGSEYHAWVECAPCTPRTVEHLTVRRDGEDVVLRWPTDHDFTGTYSIYRSARYAEWPGPAWELLASELNPTQISRDWETYSHSGAAASLSSQYYVVIRVCQ